MWAFVCRNEDEVIRQMPLWGDNILVDLKEYFEMVKRREQMAIQRNGQCFCGSGKKQKDCHNNVDENSYVAHIVMNYMEIDKRLRALYEKRRSKIICEKGCHDCCDDVFDIGIGEYFVLRAALLRRNTNALAKYIAYAQETIKPLLQSAELKAVFNGEIAMADTGISAKYNMCPFLDEDGLCGEYKDRSFVCRLHGSLDSFGVCRKIQKAQRKIVNRLKRKKLLLYCEEGGFRDVAAYIQYFPNMQDDVFSYDKSGNPHVLQAKIEAHPLLYWLANDSRFAAQYDDAVQMGIIGYCNKYGK